jgi:hypothetical protein
MIPPPPIYTPAQSRIVLYIVFLYIETLYLLIYIIYMENVFKKARADRLFVSSLSFVSVFMMQIKLKQRILLLKKIVISFLCGCDVSYFFIFFYFFSKSVGCRRACMKFWMAGIWPAHAPLSSGNTWDMTMPFWGHRLASFLHTKSSITYVCSSHFEKLISGFLNFKLLFVCNQLQAKVCNGGALLRNKLWLI